MALYGRDRNRLDANQTQAISHPVRLDILGLFTKDRARSLAADDLLTDLLADDPETYAKYDAGQIFYHRARLQDARLLPTE